MSPHLESRLKEKHPYVLQGFNQPFECGDGWFQIIDDMLTDLCSPVEECYQEQKTKPQLLQLKEKFGELRLYFCPYSLAIEETIYDYVKESRKTCETCGAPGEVRASRSGWIATRCDLHNDLAVMGHS